MDEREEEQAERPRPRIVDKRRTSKSSSGPSPEAPEAGTPSEADPVSTPAPGGPPRPPEEASAPAPGEDPGISSEAPGAEERVWTPEEEAAAQQMARELAERPSADWVLNIAVTLANVAGAKIQLGAPGDARLAIDALEAIVNSVASQLEGAEAPLRQTLAQLQMAYAQAVKPPPGP